MTEYVKEEKAFVGAAGGLLAALLVWNIWFRSPIQDSIRAAERARADAAGKMKEVFDKGMASEEQIQVARDSERGLQAAVSELEARLAFSADDRFRAPAGEHPSQHYWNVISGANRELSNRAMMRGFSWKIQDPRFLGFPGDRIPEEMAEEYLTRLAIVYRIVETITEQPAGPESAVHEIVPAESGDWGSAEGGIDPGRYLNPLRVRVRFECRGESAFRILHALTRREDDRRSPLVVERFSAKRADPNQDRLMMDVTFAALVIRPEGSLREGEEGR